MADVNIVGVVAIVVFYLIILLVGLWAARRRKEGEEEAMLAGRSIGIFVGTFTMTGIYRERSRKVVGARTYAHFSPMLVLSYQNLLALSSF